FSFLRPCPLRSTLFPYTTLFRSVVGTQSDDVLARRQVSQLYRERLPTRVDDTIVGVDVFPVASIRCELRRAQGGSVVLCLEVYLDRQSTRLNSSHLGISYAVFCL